MWALGLAGTDPAGDRLTRRIAQHLERPGNKLRFLPFILPAVVRCIHVPAVAQNLVAALDDASDQVGVSLGEAAVDCKRNSDVELIQRLQYAEYADPVTVLT